MCVTTHACVVTVCDSRYKTRPGLIYHYTHHHKEGTESNTGGGPGGVEEEEDASSSLSPAPPGGVKAPPPIAGKPPYERPSLPTSDTNSNSSGHSAANRSSPCSPWSEGNSSSTGWESKFKLKNYDFLVLVAYL